MGAVRATAVLAGFAGLTIPLMPVQALLLKFAPDKARTFPNWYHRKVCWLIGVGITIDGEVARGPVLLVANHVSWLDIPVLSAVAPVSFVAKKEVGTWPFVSALARLQRSVFIDRTKRQSAGEAASEIAARLASGDRIVLFAEGTSSDGNRVLPFRTSLFGAVIPSGLNAPRPAAVVQTLAIVYTDVFGVPLGRADRPTIGWYGDMEMPSHAWAVLKRGPVSVRIKIGPPVPLADFPDRKRLALRSEREVRIAVHEILRDWKGPDRLKVVEPKPEQRLMSQAADQRISDKWS